MKLFHHFNRNMMLKLKIDEENRYNHFFLNGDGFIKKMNLMSYLPSIQRIRVYNYKLYA